MKRPSLVARNRVSQSGELSKNARICERLASRWRAPPLPAPVPPSRCDRSGLFTSLSASLVPRHHIPAIGLIHPSIGGFRKCREALDAFNPDVVLIWGDDQYENFREDGVPSFCVFAVDGIDSKPYARAGRPSENVWGEGPDTAFHTKGHYAAASTLAANLIKADYDVRYAYRIRYENGLPHAFINTVLYLDYDRKGFPYPVVPFHVNCYGSSVIAKRGSTAHLAGEADPNLVDPPGPNPSRCFDVGGAVAKTLADSPWRVGLVASSSWSHAFLTPKHHYLYPDNASDRARFAEMCSGKLSRWRELSTAEIEDAGQQEFLNWVCLGGAMHALGREPEIVDYVESYIFNSDKCFALFRP